MRGSPVYLGWQQIQGSNGGRTASAARAHRCAAPGKFGVEGQREVPSFRDYGCVRIKRIRQAKMLVPREGSATRRDIGEMTDAEFLRGDTRYQ
jgi:hypothetical protein